MVGRFGSREICDVTFKASQEGQKIGTKNFHKGQPVFVIDTATASSMEQATTTVYAQGGKGYNRLIAWEGEKTVTFNVTDALISPLGLAMLTGAGLADASAKALKHIHMTYDLALDAEGSAMIELDQLNDELGISAEALNICDETKFKPYATELDANGAVVGWIDADAIKIESEADAVFAGTVRVDADHAAMITVEDCANMTIKLDFYLAMSEKATQVTIAPDSFGGTFYVEADTLYRNQNGQDMAATLTFPKAKIQSGFTLSMSPTGDPSTFDFVMDAMPGYTYFDTTKKVVCDITIVGDDASNADANDHEEHEKASTAKVNTRGIKAVAADKVLVIPVARAEAGEFNIEISTADKVVFRETDELNANPDGKVEWNLRDYSVLDGTSESGLKYDKAGHFIYVNGCNAFPAVAAIDTSNVNLIAPGQITIKTWMTGEVPAEVKYNVTAQNITDCTL